MVVTRNISIVLHHAFVHFIITDEISTKLVPLDETHLDAVRGLIQTKSFRSSASRRRAQLSVAATTVRPTNLLNIISSPESMLVRQY